MRTKEQIHNPLLRLPASDQIAALPIEAREALRAVLMGLCDQAAGQAQKDWSRNKGMSAAYWKAVSIYARHAARLCRRPTAAAAI